jgi:hypothetical protein
LFAEAIKMNYTLQTIRIKEFNLTFSRSSVAEGIECIAGAIMMNSTLQKIDLQCDHIIAEGAKWIAQAIKQNY